jgi:hypothetical protein
MRSRDFVSFKLGKVLLAKTAATPPRAKVLFHPRQVELAGNRLREAILAACADFEASMQKGDKGYLRALHGRAKAQEPGINGGKARALYAKYSHLFRSGRDIDPAKIKPVMHLAPLGTDWGDLFVIVRSLWSMPYNKGYGRRLRFVIFDEYHEAVIGIIGLQSPPADLACREKLFTYPGDRKLELVNCTMDAYSVGAIPPYSFLLGGKLCAGLVAADPVRQAYWRQYAGKKTLMEGASIKQPLAAVTTTSAFGKSSMYNRLRYKDRVLAEPIGYTLGYGTLHLEHLYGDIRSYLEMSEGYNNGGFGTGPKARWQNVANALHKLGLTGELLRHGVKREVFLYSLASNLKDGMAGGSFGKPIQLSTDDYSQYWRERWALPRAERFPHWRDGDARELIAQTLAQIPQVG